MLDLGQIRAALELINWIMGDLAKTTELSPDTVRKICRGTLFGRMKGTEHKLREALNGAV